MCWTTCVAGAGAKNHRRSRGDTLIVRSRPQDRMPRTQANTILTLDVALGRDMHLP